MSEPTCNTQYQSMENTNNATCGKYTMLCMFIVFIIIIVTMTTLYIMNSHDDDIDDFGYVNNMKQYSNTIASAIHHLRG